LAPGAFAAGWVADTHGAQNGFWVSVAAGAISPVTVLAGQRSLGTNQTRRPQAAASPAE